MEEWEKTKKQAKITMLFFALFTGIFGFSLTYLIVEQSTIIMAICIIFFLLAIFTLIIGLIKIKQYKELVKQ